LSDIHIATSSDYVLQGFEEIAAATRPFLPEATMVILIVSGDIVQSG
jgi:hypothetical protein